MFKHPISMPKKTYFVVAALASVAIFAKEYAFPKADVAVSAYISPDSFEPASYGVIFVAGLLLMSATHRLSVVRELIRGLHDWTIAGFTAVAGGVAGWVVAESIFHVLRAGTAQLIPTIMIAATGVLFTLLPLFLDAQAQSIHASYSSFRLAPRRGPRSLWLIGLLFCGVAVVGMVLWLHGKN